MVGCQCLHKHSCTSSLGHPIVVLKIASGADNFLQSVSVVVYSTTITKGFKFKFPELIHVKFHLIVLLSFLLEFEQAKCYLLSLPFSSVKALCLWILHQFICRSLHRFVCEVLHQFICEVLLIVYVGNYVKVCNIYNVC